MINDVFTKKEPIVPLRGIHLDVKGVPPTADRLCQLLHLFATARYNMVFIEWEDAFPWTVDKRFRSPTAYTATDIKRFCKEAAQLGLELVPLVQSLGHMETPLSIPDYKSLREVPDREDGLNPLAPGAATLVRNMVDDVLLLMPNVRYFHLGGDEAYTFGKNPATKAYMEKHGKGALYLQHMDPILDHLRQQGIRPILWHDMMNDWDDAALRKLAPKSDLMVWGYHGNPDTTQGHFKTAYIQNFHNHGIRLWGATAYKGSEGYDADITDPAMHTENAVAWVQVAQRFAFEGVIATGWSRYTVAKVQCNPIDASLDSLLHVAIILHDGHSPPDGMQRCMEVLERIGEKTRFLACQESMATLTKLRDRGWQHIRDARQLGVLARQQPRRTSAANPQLGGHALHGLQDVVNEAEQLEKEIHAAFDGCIEDIWLKEYLATRIDPLREELASLRQQDKRLRDAKP